MEAITTSNLGSFILECTTAYRERPAFIIKDVTGSRRPLSFFEFNETVNKISQVLKSRFPKGDFKVGLWGENRVEWCALAIATWSSGGVLVPLMHIATEKEVKNIIAAARVDVLFISPKLNSKVAREDVPSVKEIFSLDFNQTRNATGLRSLGDLLSDLRGGQHVLPNKNAVEMKRGGDDLAVLIFTSGTTGHPKGVMLSHKNIITNILDTIDVFPTDKDDRAISVLPLSHLFELVGGFTIAHLKGICISYPDSLKPEDVLGEMRKHKATLLVAVPLFFEIIDRAIHEKIRQMSPTMQSFIAFMGGVVLEAPFLGPLIFKKIHDVFGGHVKYFVTGGAKIDPDIILRFQRLGIHFLQGYGLTETSPIISFTPLNSDKYGSVGKPVRSVNLKLIDGEICVSGASIFGGYFENPEATSQVIKEGWFHTGDIGRLDEDGFLFITGRKKDIIVTANGKNIYPEELEEAFQSSPLINEVAIIGLDSGRGEEVHGVIVPSHLAPRDPAAQKRAIWSEIEKIGSTLSDYKRVFGITISHEELPKTATKKVRKHVLKELIAKGHFGSLVSESESTTGSPHTLLNAEYEREIWLNDRLQQITKRTEIWKEAHLRQDLAVDSLTFMELISAVETHWGVYIADEDFEKVVTVDDLLKRLGGRERAAAKPEKKPFDYRDNNRFLMKALRIFIHGLFIRPVLRLFFKFKVFNRQIFDQSRNWIVTPNHASHLDLITILASVPLGKVNSTYAVAADDYFFDTKIKSLFVRVLFNAIPFERRARVDKGFKVCEEILREGGNLVIFPEGTRSLTGQLAEFKPGVGRLLAAQGYSAIPVYIRGAHEAYPKGALLPKPSPLSVYVGRPVDFSSLGADSTGYKQVALRLHEAVEDLQNRSKLQVLR